MPQVQKLVKLFERSLDVRIRTIPFGADQEVVALAYCDGLCDKARIEELVIPRLHQFYQKHRSPSAEGEMMQQLLPLSSFVGDEESIVQHVFDGNLVLLFEKTGNYYSVDLTNKPNRSIEEANTEFSVRGPRDGFIEDLPTNVALIRKRLRTISLQYDQFVLGRRSKTRVALLYLSDIASPQLIDRLKQRIEKIDIDILTSALQLGKLVDQSAFRFFPAFVYTGRPDYAVAALTRGRAVLIIDGEPTGLIAPADLFFVIKTPEDIEVATLYVGFERFIRLSGLVIAIFLPAFWTALSIYHQDQIPYRLLATLTISRQGVPMPASLEAFVMLFLLELFREAGARLPKTVGQTLSVVGGLIIGESAISAGLTSPGMVVVIAISVVATTTLVDYSLTGVASLMRIIALLFSSVLGMYGTILSMIGLLLYLSNTSSLGVPYLAPLSFKDWRQTLATLLVIPLPLKKKRPKYLNPIDDTSGDQS